jgi:hypothetical protein
VQVSFFRFWQRSYDQDDILLKALNAQYISIFKRIKHAKPLSLSIDKNQREQFVFNLEGKKVLAKILKMHAVK